MFKFDTHMHFDLYDDRVRILDYLENNQSYTIAVTNLPELYERYSGLDRNYKYTNIALGFHPELVCEYYKQIHIFEKYVDDCRFIGEIGLDFSGDNIDSKKQQIEIFEAVVEMTRKYNDKILTVHSRKAEKEVLDYTKDFPGTVILHWFSGSIMELERAIEEGKFFSINQNMISSKKGVDLIKKMPINRILIESDAPFTRGLRDNYSVDFMKKIYEGLSATKNIATYELYEKLKDNFKGILVKNV